MTITSKLTSYTNLKTIILFDRTSFQLKTNKLMVYFTGMQGLKVILFPKNN